MSEPPDSTSPRLSVVIPVCDEAGNISQLAGEIEAALIARVPFEILFVDDGSTDETAQEVLAAAAAGAGRIKLLRHARRAGQTAALRTGIRAARAEWVATLDGDGQNDPADIPRLLDELAQRGDSRVLLITGHRTSRQDTWLRRVSSFVANLVRRRLLSDGTPDTGCGLKLLHRPTFLELPHFNHMHRFLPALVQRAGGLAISVPVRHRPRIHGRSKYGLHDRLWTGIIDLAGVMWLIRRRLPVSAADESQPHNASPSCREHPGGPR